MRLYGSRPAAKAAAGCQAIAAALLLPAAAAAAELAPRAGCQDVAPLPLVLLLLSPLPLLLALAGGAWGVSTALHRAPAATCAARSV